MTRLPAALLLLLPGIVLAQTPVLTLGTPTWSAAEGFTSLSSARALPDGRVLAIDMGEPALYLIAADGSAMQQVGRTGEGPLEYTMPSRLLPLPGDSTLVVDRDGLRFLVVDPGGRLVATIRPAPDFVPMAQFTRAVDRTGAIYAQSSAFGSEPGSPVAIVRWRRGRDRIDTVGSVLVAAPRPQRRTIDGKQMIVRMVRPFEPADDWVVAPDGAIGVVHVAPFLVEWRTSGGATRRGHGVAYQPVRVTERDKQYYEPKGPPFRRQYPEVKPPFAREYSELDARGRIWVRRSLPAGTDHTEWDLFGTSGERCATVRAAGRYYFIGSGRDRLFLARRDSDDLYWLEGFAMPAAGCR